MTSEEILAPDDVDRGDGDEETAPENGTIIESPEKVLRIGAMVKQLLEEVRSTELDEAAREQLRRIYDSSLAELAMTLPDELRDELDRLTDPFEDDSIPSEAQILVAKAQLVGWLEGLFHGIQAMVMAQQMAAQQQLQGMRKRLPAGEKPPGSGPGYI